MLCLIIATVQVALFIPRLWDSVLPLIHVSTSELTCGTYFGVSVLPR